MSAVLAVYYLCKYLYVGVAMAGWTTIVLLILFFGGMQLLSLGIVGEYLIRILREVRSSPGFAIREKKISDNETCTVDAMAPDGFDGL